MEKTQQKYDFVPKEAVWKVLVKFSDPPEMLRVNRSSHDEMCAEVLQRALRTKNQAGMHSSAL